jgi:TatD DNase family protein
MIDTHAHLAFQEKFPIEKLGDVLEQAWQNDVQAIIVPIGSEEELHVIEDVLALDQRLYGLVGYHPEDAGNISLQQVKQLVGFFDNPRIVGIGEAGIDYYWKDSLHVRSEQKALCAEQMQLAIEYDKPICLHLRDKDGREEAAEVLLGLLHDYPAKAILHSCTLPPHLLKNFLKLENCSVSFSGILTFKSASEVRESAKLVPLDRLLVETDSPYLAPEPYRGMQNTPALVKLTTEKLAEIKEMDFHKLTNEITKNAKMLFKLHI